MANENDEVVVEVADEQVTNPDAGVTVEQKTEPKVEAKVEPKAEDDAIADLRRQHEELLARERNRAAAAEQRAQQSEQEVQTARTEIAETRLDTITAGIEASQAEGDAAAQEHQAALEAGDFAKATAAQRKIAKAEARIVRLEEAKSDIEAQKAAKPVIQKQEQRQPEIPSDPVEAYVAGRPQETQNWLRSHPEFITDQRKNQKLTAAHFDATAEGKTPNTADYFDHIEKYIGLRKDEKPVQQQQQPQRKSASPPVAPVGQPSGGSVNGGATQVRLSRNEVAAATDGTHVWGKHDLAAGRIKDASLIGSAIGTQEFARRKKLQTDQGLHDAAGYIQQ